MREGLQDLIEQMLTERLRGNRFLEKPSRNVIHFEWNDLAEFWETFVMEGTVFSVGNPSPEEVNERPYFIPIQSDGVSTKQGEIPISNMRKLHRQSERSLEERGYRSLILAVGQVGWATETHSGVAPVLLIPVDVSLSKRRNKATVQYTGEPIQLNPAVMIKLLQEMQVSSIEIPSLDDDLSDCTTLEIQRLIEVFFEYCSGVDWSSEMTVYIDVIQSAQLQFVKDLDPINWTDDDFGLLQQMFNVGFTVDHQIQTMSSSKIENSVNNPASLNLILEADPAQTRAVAIAANGGNLVVQGPPGTGKSQTIANIMAHLASQGKKILFVSQKKAALDVVYRRLCQANVQHLLLEIHSTKAKRSTVLRSILSAKEQNQVVSQFDDLMCEEHRKAKEQMQETSNWLKGTVGQTTAQVSEIFAENNRTELPDDPTPIFFQDSLNWNASHTTLLKDSSFEVFNLVFGESLRWQSNPFRCTNVADSSMNTKEIFNECTILLDELTCFMKSLDDVEHNLGCRFERTWSGIDTALSILDVFVHRPDVSELDCTQLQFSENQEFAYSVINKGKSLALTQERLGTVFEPYVLVKQTDVVTTLTTLETMNRRWWKLLAPSWWSSLKRMKLFFKKRSELSIEEWRGPVEELDAFYEKIVDLEEKSEWAGHLFGRHWNGVSTDWEDLRWRLKWALDSHQWSAKNLHSADILQRPQLAEEASKARTLIQQQRLTIQTRVSSLLERWGCLKGHPLVVQGSDPLIRIVDWLQDSNCTSVSLSRAIAINQVCMPLRESGLESWVHRLQSCADVDEVGHFWESNLWASRKRLLLQQSQTHQMTHSNITRQRQRYQELDSKMIHLAQESIVSNHSRAVNQTLEVGPMRVLAQELNRPRARRSIRRLMQECGPAVQHIKPIFLMSPMSVSMYLPPKEMVFDVVVFDEASQLTTPFALGSLLRSKQAIVVGDSQQMPPTNFFNSGGKLESILDCFVGNNCPQIQLSYHYRSRDPSLIAVSNNWMYQGQLKAFPSANSQTIETGVFLESTKGHFYERSTNMGEANVISKHLESLLTKYDSSESIPTIGVVAFSVAQRDAIEEAWENTLRSNQKLENVMARWDTSERLFIKNLEDVQGDERDIILISVGYGFQQDGTFIQGFGPITQSGGDRRLNVLFTRARYRMVLFANFPASSLTNPNPSVQMLKSVMQIPAKESSKPSVVKSSFVEDICSFLSESGFKTVQQYGPEGNVVDIAVRDLQNSEQFCLAILCENGSWTRHSSIRYRERSFPNILESFGWNILYVWSIPWYQNPIAERQRVLQALHNSLDKNVHHQTSFKINREAVSTHSNFQMRNRVMMDSDDCTKFGIVVPLGSAPKQYPKITERLISILLDGEGPMSMKHLQDRVCQLFCYRRTKTQLEFISQVLKTIEHKGRICTLEGFYWTEETEMSPSLPPSDLKDIGEMYPPHLTWLIVFYLQGSVTKSIAVDEMAEVILLVCGWQNLRKKNIEKVKVKISSLSENSGFYISDGVLILGEPSSE